MIPSFVFFTAFFFCPFVPVLLSRRFPVNTVHSSTMTLPPREGAKGFFFLWFPPLTCLRTLSLHSESFSVYLTTLRARTDIAMNVSCSNEIPLFHRNPGLPWYPPFSPPTRPITGFSPFASHGSCRSRSSDPGPFPPFRMQRIRFFERDWRRENLFPLPGLREFVFPRESLKQPLSVLYPPLQVPANATRTFPPSPPLGLESSMTNLMPFYPIVLQKSCLLPR